MRKTRARLLVVSDVTSLFLDSDVPKGEARELFTKFCSKLSEMAFKERIIVVVSYFPEGRSRQGLFLEAVLFGKCNVLIKLNGRSNVHTFVLEDHPCIKPFTVDFTIDQTFSRICGGASLGENRSIL